MDKNPDTGDFFSCNHLELVRGGKAYFDLLVSLIDNARESIHFQVYLFEKDATGQRVLNALDRAVERGVEVNLIIDAFGSNKFPELEIKRLESSPVNFRIFGPLFSSNNLGIGRRMHHKIFVADSRKSLVGGINIADKYNDLEGQKAWLDFALYTEASNISAELVNVCRDIWGRDFVQLKSKKDAAEEEGQPESYAHKVKINTHDWLRRRIGIGKSYIKAFEKAGEEIIILGSYFMPSRRIRKRLKAASERGVKVKVILSKYADVPFAAEASRFLYDWMFRYDIRVFEWGDSVLHGKVAAVDDEWATVGSYNLNFLSDYESIELNLEVISKSLNKKLKNSLNQIIDEGGEEVLREDFGKRYHILRRLKGWFSYILVRYSFRFLLLFSRKEKR